MSKFVSVLVGLGSLSVILGLFVGCATAATVPLAAPDNPWSRVTTPSSARPAISIGSTGAGCIDGAVALPANGKGYQVMRLSRKRYYGHPVLLGYLKRLGRDAKKRGLGTVLFGDLGQPRGGPMLSGHASHQSGLDVDVWYWHPSFADERLLTREEREELSAPSLVKGWDEMDPAYWNPRAAKLIKVAASSESVERIFVNAAIKRELCREKRPGSEKWLQKLRPWWGHADHLHIRLNCPVDALAGAPAESKVCVQAAPIPPGDGCDETLDWWFTDEAKEEWKKITEKPPATRLPTLPAACSVVLNKDTVPGGVPATPVLPVSAVQ